MLRWIRIPLGLVLILSVTGGSARAQYGWGWGGWGGWGETPQGSIARGLGALYAGEGMYNQQTAVARSINEDTWQRWNQYLYLSNEEATRKYLSKKNYDIQKNKDSYNSIVKRLQDAPTAKDVDDGDALERSPRSVVGSPDPELVAQGRFGTDTGEYHRRDSVPVRFGSGDDHHEQAEGRKAVAVRAGYPRDSRPINENSKRSRNRLARKMRMARFRLRRSGGRMHW